MKAVNSAGRSVQVVRIVGGLGNQMFAYAFALALKGLGREVAIDASWFERIQAHNGWELDRLFKLDIPHCDIRDRDRLGDIDTGLGSRLRRKLFGPSRGHVRQRGSGYDPRYLKIEGEAYFEGYWQSWRYHVGAEREIESALSFPGQLEEEGRALFGAAAGRTIVGVHVRRGDYLESDELGAVCGEGYYRRAIKRLFEGSADPLLVFFSDDLDWCRRRLGAGRDAVYVDWNRGSDSWRDMRLMTLCDRLAISNSSFSWWGARLGRKDGRMIAAPTRWFGGRHPDNPDIAPPAWIRVAAGE